MTTRDIRPFDVCGPLPTGTTVLEASAGTGKTYTIAALATRYVAEGVATLPELMLVTFSRAATQELRERVRERLVSAEHGLSDPRRALLDGDELLALLADASPGEVKLRRHRLTRALAGFDAATIATTHGFCRQMLAGLGLAGDVDPGFTFVEDIDDLVVEVVGDLYLRSFTGATGEPAVDHRAALRVAQAAIGDPQATLVPADAPEGSAARVRHAMAIAATEEIRGRKRTRRLLDYDDLVSRLDDALRDRVRGPAAVERVRSRYRVVLVDEFQDTDPLQWRILQTAFHGATTLVLIGDPKQAIYAFRGADLVTYLAATSAATAHRTLARNWRSDRPLLGALRSVFRGAALGDERIPVREVEAHHDTARLTSAGPALRLRVVRRALVGESDRAKIKVKEARPIVADDLAHDVVGLLDGPARLALRGTNSRRVSPGDVAVLARTNDQATLVRDALAAAGVPAALAGSRSVFLAPAARDWRTLLRALEQPHRAGLVRAAALTCFVGWTPQQLADSGDAGTDELGRLLRAWREVWAERGVAALLEVMGSSTGLTERLLAADDGERRLTDVRHIGQALHATAVAGRLGPAAVVEWLQRRIAEAAEDAAEERSRRLESDADAVQVVTIHGAKGLQFPVVYVPFGWDRWVGDSPDSLLLHDEDGTRLRDVGGPDGPGYPERRERHLAEELGEDLRLLYVAMTRARCQVIATWVPATTTEQSPLHRLLFGTFDEGGQPPARVPLRRDADVRKRLDELAAGAGGTVAVEDVGEDQSAHWRPVAAEALPLAAAVFDRRLDEGWRRTSYTGLTRFVHDGLADMPGVASEPELEDRQDEPALAAPPEPPVLDLLDAAMRSVPSPLAGFPSGTAFGTLVHGVLETVDTVADDLEAELRARCQEAVARRLGTAVDPAALATALLPVFDTPLGPLAGGFRLRDITLADRLAELDFELPLAGGDHPRGSDATLSALADLLRRHLPASDPLAGYADALDSPGLAWQRLRGYLSGSIDAVLRLPAPDGDPRYVVVDYKTNWLGTYGPDGAEPLTAWHYRPAALAVEMIRAHYPLQALLYAAALHRFLRWRQPGYDPTRHLGGVLYLFLRGMCGPETPVVGGTPCGVFSWRPPAGLVEDLSALLDRGVP